MPTHTIQLSEDVYRRLSEQAAQLHLTPDQLIERFLTLDLFVAELDDPMPPPDSEESLAAFQRLTTCFADVHISNIEEVLNDPLIALENVDIADIDELLR